MLVLKHTPFLNVKNRWQWLGFAILFFYWFMKLLIELPKLTNIQKPSLEHFLKVIDVIRSWNRADLLHATTLQRKKIFLLYFNFWWLQDYILFWNWWHLHLHYSFYCYKLMKFRTSLRLKAPFRNNEGNLTFFANFPSKNLKLTFCSTKGFRSPGKVILLTFLGRYAMGLLITRMVVITFL